MQIACNALAQTGDSKLDSMISVYHSLGDRDTSKLGVCKQIAFGHFNVDSTIMWSERLINLSRYHKSKYYESRALGYMSWAYFYKGNLSKSIDFNYEGLAIADSDSDIESMAYHSYMLGNNFSSLCDYWTADTYLRHAYDLYSSIGDTVKMVQCCRCMANNLVDQNIYSDADSIMAVSLHLDSLMGNLTELSEDFGSIAVFRLSEYFNSQESNSLRLLSEAREFALMGLSLGLDGSYHYILYVTLMRSMFLELDNQKYTGNYRKQFLDSIYTYCSDAYAYVGKMNSRLAKMSIDLCYGNYLVFSGRMDEAASLADSLSGIISDDPDLYAMRTGQYYKFMERFYVAKQNIDSALYYNRKFYKLNYQYLDSKLLSVKNVVSLKYEQKIRDNVVDEERRKFYNILLYVFIVMLIIPLVFSFIRTRNGNRILNEKNEILMAQKEKLLYLSVQLGQQNDAIAYQHRQITDSIKYASLIQHSVLPKQDVLESMFSDFMLIYRPLNIVAGDFYWTTQFDKFKVVVCADCTGHGVPGAFVSMLGISILNEVAHKIWTAHADAGMILDVLREKLMSALGQSQEMFDSGLMSNMDGMDLALVVIDSETLEAQYAGALRPLWIYRDGDIIEYKADRMPIGLYLGSQTNFTRHDIQLMSGDVLYMFSDGIPDQFGYTDDDHTEYKHFSTKKLKWLLSEVGDKPLSQQKTFIENAFDNWKNGYQQLDDIIMIGFRV